MRPSKDTTGTHPSWSAAGNGQGFDWTSTLDRAVSGTPAWALTVTAGVVVLALLGMSYLTTRALWRAAERTRKRRRADLDRARAEGREDVLGLGTMGRQAYVALGGMVVSVYGMWGFALDTAQLPEPIAVGFIAMFDAMELVLFAQLYKLANPRVGWTPQLRLIHKTAWALVAVSATANFIHAPNPVAAPFMAAMPIGAAWVIELEFRARMRGTETEDDESGAGPVRLVVLLWSKGWAAAFSGLGLDPNSTSGQVARATLAGKAADRLFRLRERLEQNSKLAKDGRAKRRDLIRAVKDLDTRRRLATRAMDRSEFGVESGQTLAVLRGLATKTRVDDVATVNTADPIAVKTLMEEVAILPAAEAIEAGERAAALEAAAERAEAARQDAEDARERAEEEKRAAVAAREAAETAQKDAETARAEALVEVETAREEKRRAVTARQDAEAARKRAEDELSEDAQNVAQLADRAQKEQRRLEDASEELERVRRLVAEEKTAGEKVSGEVAALRTRLEKLQDVQREARGSARTAEDDAVRLRGEVEQLQTALTDAQRKAREHRSAAESAAELRRRAEAEQRQAAEAAGRLRAEVAEAERLLDALRPQLADRLGGESEAVAAAEAPAFRSEAKQAGWELYLAAATEGRALPTATELADLCGVSEGNVRNWLTEFGRRRAGMIASGSARQTAGGTERSEARRAEPRGARQEPSGNRADGHERADDAAQGLRVNGQRQPV
ncbi:hypothetical protein ACH432_31715 [Streptomyces jumonjinensis]|uniref:hypothetical protein n=1 Tax=Streptomyces jumonjinensis TaxID=1945 RepID=UPI0037AAAABE